MHRHAVFSALHRGTPLAAAMECENPTRLAFVGVYPLDLSSPLTRELLRNHGFSIFPEAGRVYSVRTFEVEKRLIEADVWVGPRDLIAPTRSFAFDDEHLANELEKLNVPLEHLEPHYKSDYPI